MSKNTVSTYACNCGHVLTDHVGMKKHLLEAHGIDTKKTKATRQAITFLDGAGWAEQHYEIKIGGQTINQVVHIETK